MQGGRREGSENGSGKQTFNESICIFCPRPWPCVCQAFDGGEGGGGEWRGASFFLIVQEA